MPSLLLIIVCSMVKGNKVNKNVRRRKNFIFLTEQLWALWPRAGNVLEDAYAIFAFDFFGSMPPPLPIY